MISHRKYNQKQDWIYSKYSYGCGKRRIPATRYISDFFDGKSFLIYSILILIFLFFLWAVFYLMTPPVPQNKISLTEPEQKTVITMDIIGRPKAVQQKVEANHRTDISAEPEKDKTEAVKSSAKEIENIPDKTQTDNQFNNKNPKPETAEKSKAVADSKLPVMPQKPQPVENRMPVFKKADPVRKPQFQKFTAASQQLQHVNKAETDAYSLSSVKQKKTYEKNAVQSLKHKRVAESPETVTRNTSSVPRAEQTLKKHNAIRSAGNTLSGMKVGLSAAADKVPAASGSRLAVNLNKSGHSGISAVHPIVTVSSAFSHGSVINSPQSAISHSLVSDGIKFRPQQTAEDFKSSGDISGKSGHQTLPSASKAADESGFNAQRLDRKSKASSDGHTGKETSAAGKHGLNNSIAQAADIPAAADSTADEKKLKLSDLKTDAVRIGSLPVCTNTDRQSILQNKISALLSSQYKRGAVICRDSNGKFVFTNYRTGMTLSIMFSATSNNKFKNRCDVLNQAYKCLKNR